VVSESPASKEENESSVSILMMESVMSSQMEVGMREFGHSSKDGLRKKDWTDGEEAAEEEVEEAAEEEVGVETAAASTGLLLVDLSCSDAGRGVSGGGGGMREVERRRCASPDEGGLVEEEEEEGSILRLSLKEEEEEEAAS